MRSSVPRADIGLRSFYNIMEMVIITKPRNLKSFDFGPNSARMRERRNCYCQLKFNFINKPHFNGRAPAYENDCVTIKIFPKIFTFKIQPNLLKHFLICVDALKLSNLRLQMAYACSPFCDITFTDII